MCWDKKATEDCTVLIELPCALPNDNYCILIRAFVTSNLRVNEERGQNSMYLICLLL